MEKRDIIKIISTTCFVFGIIGVIVLLIPIHTWNCSLNLQCANGARNTIVYPEDLGQCEQGKCSKKASAEDSGGNIAILSIASLLALGGIGMGIYLLCTMENKSSINSSI